MDQRRAPAPDRPSAWHLRGEVRKPRGRRLPFVDRRAEVGLVSEPLRSSNSYWQMDQSLNTGEAGIVMPTMIAKREPMRGTRGRIWASQTRAELSLQNAKQLVDEAEERVRCQSEIVASAGAHEYPLHVTLTVLAYLEQDLQRCNQRLRSLEVEH